MSRASLAGVLAGVRVLDASRVLAGPFAAQILADLGAEVIKVEEPELGDETRQWGPPFAGAAAGGMSAYFMACNRGKRSVALDLKRPSGRELFLRLAAASDVVLENFRADSSARLRLEPQDLHAVNPKLVVCSISGYGREGVAAGQAGYDFVVQGLSGMMAATGPAAGPPSKFGVAIADLATAHYAVIAVLAGLRGREATGHGYAVDLALLDCAVATMANVAQAHLVSGKTPARQGNAHLQIVPYQAFETAPSPVPWVVVAVGNDRQFQRFAAVLGHPEWADEPRFGTNAARVENRQALIALLEPLFKTKPAAAWVAALTAAQVPAGPVWTLGELFQSDLARERSLKITARRPDGTPVELVASPLVRQGDVAAPPSLGADTEAVLRDVLGAQGADVAKWRADGAFG